MKLTKCEKQAARAFRRVFAERTAGWDEAEAADAGFDRGEFSGPVWMQRWEAAATEAAEMVAERFDLYAHHLLNAVHALSNIEWRRYLESAFNRNDEMTA